MSGQAGIYYFDQRPMDRSLARRLGEGLAEQGPDGGSEHFGPGLLMVYRAFTFDPLSRSERQPYQSAKGNWVTFDGRLDNRDDLVLLAGDYLREDKTDVALALAAYEKWGEPGLNRLLGDWSVAIWDAEKRAIVLASDYMGARPLWYFANNDFIAWSSDLSLLAEWMDVKDKFDNHYISAYLQGKQRYDRTVYEGIQYVSCGQAILSSQSKRAITKFWHLPIETRIRYRTTEDYAEHLLHLFREAVQSRLRTDRVVCCDLSGGLDSSSVVCMASHLVRTGAASPSKLISFSIMDTTMDDREFIPVVEQHCGISGVHSGVVPLWPSETSPMPGRRTGLDQQQVYRDRGVRARLTGIGGDNVMGNLPDDIDQLADHIYQLSWSNLMKDAYTWSRAQRTPIWRVIGDGLIPLLPEKAQQRLWRKKVKNAASYSHLCSVSCLNPEFINCYADDERLIGSIDFRSALPSQRHFMRSMLEFQLCHGLGTYCQHGDVKPSHPYFHRPLFEFISTIPRRELCQPGFPRRLMRHAFAALLPKAVLHRQTKSGGQAAIDLQIQDLTPSLEHSPLLVESKGYVNGAVVREVLQNPQAPNYDRAELGKVLNLEMWFRIRATAYGSNGVESVLMSQHAERDRKS